MSKPVWIILEAHDASTATKLRAWLTRRGLIVERKKECVRVLTNERRFDRVDRIVQDGCEEYAAINLGSSYYLPTW